MNYQHIYDSLIERGKTRKLDCYVEKHHIIPRCLGGNDDKFNLVELTPEEHYVAHQLLVKIYPDNHKLARAVAMMITNRPSNKMYGWVRRRFSIVQSESQRGQRNSQYGTLWVHNPMNGKSKKIKGDIEDGWVRGRMPIAKPPKVDKRKEIKEKLVNEYTIYYEIYSKVGFKKFVEISGYTKSKANLVQMFSRHVKGFVPQNGKRR